MTSAGVMRTGNPRKNRQLSFSRTSFLLSSSTVWSVFSPFLWITHNSISYILFILLLHTPQDFTYSEVAVQVANGAIKRIIKIVIYDSGRTKWCKPFMVLKRVGKLDVCRIWWWNWLKKEHIVGYTQCVLQQKAMLSVQRTVVHIWVEMIIRRDSASSAD